MAFISHAGLTAAVFRSKVELHRRFRISYWDAAIVAAAKLMGCRAILSEDLNAGQNFDGVVIRNPF